MIKAKYTVVLKTLMDDPEVKNELERAMGTYPLYKPLHKELYGYIPTRQELNSKILNYYKYREIGFETIGRFLDELEISLIEIMPHYNQLYKSVDVMNDIDNIFGNVDILESYEEESKGSSKGVSESKSNIKSSSETTSEMHSNNKDVDSTMPQDSLNIGAADMDNITHADKVTWNKNDSTSSGTNTDNSDSTSEGLSTNESSGTISHTLHRKGNHGVNTYAHDMLEFRDLFVNIEQQIINDPRIRELFMQIY